MTKMTTGAWNRMAALAAAGLSLISIHAAQANVVAYESFDLAEEYAAEAGSGAGWGGDWTAITSIGDGLGLQLSQDGQSLNYPAGSDLIASGSRVNHEGGGASERFLKYAFSLSASADPYYISFLARKDENGVFRIESRRPDGVSRWRVRVGADGAVGVGIDTWVDTAPGLFENGGTYLVVSKFVPGSKDQINVPGTSANVYVKIFEAGVDTLPETDADISWDISLNRGTHVSQDRFRLIVDAGQVELDEFRFSHSWEAVVSGGEMPSYQAWREQHFTVAELTDPGISGPGAEPAGDGVPNLLKYAFFDLAAKEPVSPSMLPQAAFVNGSLRLTYPERSDATDIDYIVEVSNDLKTWSSAKTGEIGRVFDGFANQVTVAALAPPGALAVEPFAFSGSALDGAGSGTGWNGDWFAATGGGVGLAQEGGSLTYPAGSSLNATGSRAFSEGIEDVASTRLLHSAISFAGGNQPVYLSFLARKSDNGGFRIEAGRSDGISRWGIDVLSSGIVGVKVVTWSDSPENLFEENKTYLVVSKFTPNPVVGGSSAQARVKVFEVGVDTVPADDTEVKWDAMDQADTGVSQDRITLRVLGGTVEVDELRLSRSWGAAVVQGTEEPSREFMRVSATLRDSGEED